MLQTTQSTSPAQAPVERTFDEHGNTIEETVATQATGSQTETEPIEATVPPPPKFRIGDKEFQTQEEALAYATSAVSTLQTEAQVADAYRQGIRDAVAQSTSASQSVTPPAQPALNTEELYTNPSEFLAKYGKQISEQTLAQVRTQLETKEQSNQIWREFCDRHPALADFRSDVESFVERNMTDVRAIIGTKGRDASYDYIATKLRTEWEKRANAIKPKTELPNTRTVSQPRAASESVTEVTQKGGQKKQVTFAEQINSIRRRGRAR